MFARKTFLLRTTAIVAVSLISAAAHGQNDSQPTPGSDQAQKGKVANQGKPGDTRTATGQQDTIVVTGSRLGTTEFNSPAPIQVITAESIRERGIDNTADAVQQSSIVSGSIQQNQTTVGFVQNGIQAGQGLASANLRGLDALRTLVLVNGRRVTPAGAGGNIGPVDLSVIPISMVSRIEVLKDGGSSIYGSDAIGGVVNIITRKDLNGAFLDLQGTHPFETGGESIKVAAGGGISSSRADASLSLEYYQQKRLPLASRSFLACNQDIFFDPNTHQRIDIVDPATGQYKCFNAFSGGVTVPGISGQLQYDPNNVRGPYGSYDANPYLSLGFHRVDITGNTASWARSNFDNPLWAQGNSALPETRRLGAFASADYNLTQDVQVYAEGLYSRRTTWLTNLAYPAVTVAAAHPSNPFGRSAQIFLPNPPRGIDLDNRPETLVNYYQVTLGMRGTFGGNGFLSGWKWDAYGQTGHSHATFSFINFLTDAYQYSDGNLANGECFKNGVTETPISHRQCTAINWFSPEKLSGQSGLTQSEADLLLIRQKNVTDYSQRVAEVSLTGTAFSLPGGPVRMALGSQYIYDAIDDEPDHQAQIGNVGLTGGVAGPTVGNQHSLDVYGEVVAPILRNSRFARELTLTGSVRASHPQNIDWHWTYEGGLNWALNRLFRVRATYGTSFRAPAIYEKKLAGTLTGFTQPSVDPCINPTDTTIAQRCLAEGIPANYTGAGPSGLMPFAIVTQSGNPDLKPETSKTWTVGGAITPSFTDLSIAIDYWNINLTNKIGTLGGIQAFLCYEADDYPTNPYCSLFARDLDPNSPNYLTITTVNDKYLNVALQKTNGVDLTARWNIPLRAGLVFRMDHQYTRTFHDKRAAFAGSPFVENNGILLQPKFSGTSIFSLDHRDWAVSWNMQVIGRTSSVPLNGTSASSARFGTVEVIRSTPTVIYHGITARKRFDRLGFTAQVGIQNLFDKDPPAISNAYIYRRGTAPLSLYDFLGRRVFVSLHKTF